MIGVKMRLEEGVREVCEKVRLQAELLVQSFGRRAVIGLEAQNLYWGWKRLGRVENRPLKEDEGCFMVS